MPGWSLERLVGRAAKEKLTVLAWNRDPREIETYRRARSAGAQSALGRKPAEERVFRPALRHLADRIGTRLRAKSRLGRTVTVRVRFGDFQLPGEFGVFTFRYPNVTPCELRWKTSRYNEHLTD
jgi:DNA polymerase IV